MRYLARALALALAFASLAPWTTASAVPTIFTNCATMNIYFPGGVTVPGAINAGRKTTLLPFPSRSIYVSNRQLDTDRDSIVCER